MGKKSNNIFERKHFKKESSSWIVIIIATLISLALAISFLYWQHSAQSKKTTNPLQSLINIPSHIVTPPLIAHEESASTQSLPAETVTPVSIPEDTTEATTATITSKAPIIYKCKSDTKIIYSETPCPSGSNNEDLKIVDSSSDASRFRNYINQPREAQSNEVSTNTPELMSAYAIKLRIDELEATIRSISSSEENIAASNEELAYMQRKPKQLSNADEVKRRAYRVDLERLDDDARYKAWGALKSDIYSKY